MGPPRRSLGSAGAYGSPYDHGVPLSDDDLRLRARVLRDLVEPICANVYFAPEAHDAYAELGLDTFDTGYFPSRGGCLGQAPGEVIAAAFGVFAPSKVTAAVDTAWALTNVGAVLAARERGAVASLARILGTDAPAGWERAVAILRRAADAAPFEARALFCGLRSLGSPGTPLGDLWRACDVVREHRGDSHVIAWSWAGLSPVQATVTTELWWRLPLRSYVRTRGWDEAEIDAAIEDLRARGLMDGDEFSPAGHACRAEVEWHTDRMERPLLEAIGDDADELFGLLAPWKQAVVEARGYPVDPAALSRYDE